MKVTVDPGTCIGCGLCEQLCSDVFKLGDDNIAHVQKQECASCDVKDVASQCPVDAIKVEG